MCLIHRMSGNFRYEPYEIYDRLSVASKDLLKRAFEDIDPSKLMDYHTHVAGTGAGGTNLYVNPRMRTWLHPFHRMKFSFYMSACGVKKEENADQEMIGRLLQLAEHAPVRAKHCLLAFDRYYNPDGTANLDKTEFYVPNEYVFQMAEQHPDLLIPVMSVHPYRADAISELEKCAARGGRIVKWLPNAMGMNPSDRRCDAFYEKMKELNLILLSHGGEEKAVHAEEDQKLGNPLLLRKPLDFGVKVIVAHCASLGTNVDPDHPSGPRISNFKLFMQLMDEPRYRDLVFGEISAMTQFNRVGEPLSTILAREDWHHRLLNGSDYPLPAVNLLIRTAPLVAKGFLNATDAQSLKEIYKINPILFDFTLKRCLKSPTTNRKLPASIFHAHPSILIVR